MRLLRRLRALGGVDVERRRAHPDVVARRGGDRAVDAEDGDRERLSRSGVAGEDDAVRRVEAGNDRAARVAEGVRQLAVHPDLGIVVDHDLEHDRRARRVELADPLGEGDVDRVPVEADAAVREAKLRLARRQLTPVAVADDVVGPVRDGAGAERILRRAELDELDLLDPGIGIAPAAADEGDSLVGLQVDDRVGAARQELARPGQPGGGDERIDGGHGYASTLTTKYRNGSETSTN